MRGPGLAGAEFPGRNLAIELERPFEVGDDRAVGAEAEHGGSRVLLGHRRPLRLPATTTAAARDDGGRRKQRRYESGHEYSERHRSLPKTTAAFSQGQAITLSAESAKNTMGIPAEPPSK